MKARAVQRAIKSWTIARLRFDTTISFMAQEIDEDRPRERERESTRKKPGIRSAPFAEQCRGSTEQPDE